MSNTSHMMLFHFKYASQTSLSTENKQNGTKHNTQPGLTMKQCNRVNQRVCFIILGLSHQVLPEDMARQGGNVSEGFSHTPTNAARSQIARCGCLHPSFCRYQSTLLDNGQMCANNLHRSLRRYAQPNLDLVSPLRRQLYVVGESNSWYYMFQVGCCYADSCRMLRKSKPRQHRPLRLAIRHTPCHLHATRPRHSRRWDRRVSPRHQTAPSRHPAMSTSPRPHSSTSYLCCSSLLSTLNATRSSEFLKHPV